MKNYKYKEVIDILNNSLDSITDDKVTCVNDIYNLLNIEDKGHVLVLLLGIIVTDINQKYVVKRCKNCGKLFIPYKKNDALYCDRISPQNSSMTCKRYSSQQPQSSSSKLYKKIYMKKSVRAKRHKDNFTITNEFENWKSQVDKLRADYNKGKITDKEFEKWLIENDK